MCVQTCVLFSFAHMCGFRRQVGFINLQVVFVFSHRSLKAICICVGSLRVTQMEKASETERDVSRGRRRTRLNDHRENVMEELFL